MRTNRAVQRKAIVTHEGGTAARITPEQQLRRSVLSCMLYEKEFYEDGQSIADRIMNGAAHVSPMVLASLAVEARSKFNLRHVPLLLLSILAQHARRTSLLSDVMPGVIQRADELAELLAVYAKVNGVTPDKLKPKLSNQVRKGLARAFLKFNEYQLAKYDRAGAVRLRDVLFLCHAKPVHDGQEAMWKRLIANELTTPDTWEVALSGGANKKEVFERLISEGKLGYLALLRNLRNMVQAGCNPALVSAAIVARKGGAERVLPFRFVAAARAAPQFEPALDHALYQTISDLPLLPDRTVVLVDVSGSMDAKLSGKSDMTRMDAAATLASVINAESLRVFSFSNTLVEAPPRRGMAGVDAIRRSQHHASTELAAAVAKINANVPHDRLIVITDEQMHPGKLEAPVCGRGYMINVASYQNGVGYGPWTHLDGMSEQVIRWIIEFEGGDTSALTGVDVEMD